MLSAPVLPASIPADLPPRPTLLPLSFVLVLVALVGCGSAVLTLVVANIFFNEQRVAGQAGVVTIPTAVELPPRPEPEKPAPPGADTLAVLPFEMLFEPTPTLRHEVEKLNATLLPVLATEGKLRVAPLAQTAPLRYCRDPIEAARALKVRGILIVKFTTEAAPDESTCHLELVDTTSGFLLWGMEIDAPGGFLKHPERSRADSPGDPRKRAARLGRTTLASSSSCDTDAAERLDFFCATRFLFNGALPPSRTRFALVCETFWRTITGTTAGLAGGGVRDEIVLLNTFDRRAKRSPRFCRSSAS